MDCTHAKTNGLRQRAAFCTPAKCLFYAPVILAGGEICVSVVIASRDEGAEIAATVQSALDAATGPIEIIVIDDASTDGSCDALCELGENVWVVRNEAPLGPGTCRAMGLRTAKGAVRFVVDAHMRFTPGLFHALAAVALKRGAIVCPTSTNMDGSSPRCGAEIHWHRDGKIGIEWRRPPKDADYEARLAVLGGCYGIPAAVYERMGHYPSTAGLWGYEEQALSAWAWFHDVPILGFRDHTAAHWFSHNPWGAPPLSGLTLNMLQAHANLLHPTTYRRVFRDHLLRGLAPADRPKLAEAEGAATNDPWQQGKRHTDYEFFRDVLRLPVTCDADGLPEAVVPITAIITARDEGTETAATVRSLVNSMHSPWPIIIVDDASTDGALDPAAFVPELQKHVYKHWREGLPARIRIIRHAKARGVSQSRAHAIEATPPGGILSIWDAHQRTITPFMVESLACTALDRGGIVIPSCCNLGKSGEKARTYGAHFELKDKWGVLNAHTTTRPDDDISRTPAVIGCGYTLTRETLAALGGWPCLPGTWGYNEQWLGFRAWFLGVPLWVDRRLTGEHLYKKEFNYKFPHTHTLLNAHACFYIHFGDAAYETIFRPRLLMHGDDPAIGRLLASADVQRRRAEFAAQKVRTDEEFLREELGIGMDGTAAALHPLTLSPIEEGTVDVAITATLRPEILRRTLRSFTDNLWRDEAANMRAVINVDSVGEEGVSAQDLLDVCGEFFPTVLSNVTEQGHYPTAFKWCWTHATAEFVFHLEDHWELTEALEWDVMVDVMREHTSLAHMRLNHLAAGEDNCRQWNVTFPLSFWDFFLCPEEKRGSVGFAGIPSLNRGLFVRQVAPILDTKYNPEKNIKGGIAGMKDILEAWDFGIFATPDSPPAVTNIGRAWMAEQGMRKKGTAAHFTEWEHVPPEHNAGGDR